MSEGDMLGWGRAADPRLMRGQLCKTALYRTASTDGASSFFLFCALKSD